MDETWGLSSTEIYMEKKKKRERATRLVEFRFVKAEISSFCSLILYSFSCPTLIPSRSSNAAPP